MKTLVSTPDPSNIRKSRLEWIASTMVLPLYRVRQSINRVRSK